MASWNVFSGAAVGICFCSARNSDALCRLAAMLPGALGAEPLRRGHLRRGQVDALLQLSRNVFGGQSDLGGDGLGRGVRLVGDHVERAGLLLTPDVDDLGMRGGELVGHRGQVERRLAVLGQLAAGDQVLAGLAQLIQGGQPGVGGVDVTALPCREDRLRLQVDQLNVLGRQVRSEPTRRAGCSAPSTRTGCRCACPSARRSS